ncbi:monovalent cation/H+ antiporter subunit D [Aromatoleum anaerobium]|uniref:Monovalent cation/H+ antiporter subunit D n=1 Tax=Aromatoleum anaerobium TaxID=182180 RepID=A0ABX1PMH9_9RHOO|nr:monovalent cation/H+ antiporter subunit D [Aromatoleum anaerobium]MCK0508680.1 monovalent cation/H+ antiporter subunit D [Aromatoleum anaerobium]
MSGWLQHLPILPVVLPLFAGAAMLLFGETQRRARTILALTATLAQLVVAVTLLGMSGGLISAPWSGEVGAYALGGWAAPFGIVLVVDRLSAIMLTLGVTLGLATLVYSLARWERAGTHFLPLSQFLLMGISGAFLTGDLFNLFVFFEVLLAASYGLVLHGSGATRVRAGLHYIVVNLVASLLFLIAAALIYGVTGTLNMAELALRIPLLVGDERALVDAAAALLGVVFLVKAGAWPLNFWLVAAYGAAAAPVAGVFAILTKVGVYALMRFETLLGDAAPAPFGGEWMFYCGLATIATGTLGMLAAQQLDRLAGCTVIVSSGTLLTAFGFDGYALTGPGLFYLVSSVLASGAFFMVIEMAERGRAIAADLLAVSFEAFGLQDPQDPRQIESVVGFPIPAAMAFLGLAFILCGVLLTGLPPLSGFVGKFTLLVAAIAFEPGAGSNAPQPWLFVAALLLSGFAGVVALSRIGVRIFWGTERSVPQLQWTEAVPVTALLLLCVALAGGAGPAMTYFNATARYLEGRGYVEAVLPAMTVTEGFAR